MAAKNYIETWHKVFKSQELEKLDEIISDNAVFTSPVVFKPMEGKEITKNVSFCCWAIFQYG